MKITWLGHACFVLEHEGFRVLLDPYRDVPGLPDLSAEAEAVYCSHGHFDHAYVEGVALTEGKENPFTVRETESFHDPENGALRGPNTIRCFTAGGLTVAHLGDLGHPLSQEQLRSIGPCDAVLIPVGGTYTIDGVQASVEAEKLGARVVIPMHYRLGDTGFPDIDALDRFLAQYPSERVSVQTSNELELTAETPRQVAVLQLPKW